MAKLTEKQKQVIKDITKEFEKINNIEIDTSWVGQMLSLKNKADSDIRLLMEVSDLNKHIAQEKLDKMFDVIEQNLSGLNLVLERGVHGIYISKSGNGSREYGAIKLHSSLKNNLQKTTAMSEAGLSSISVYDGDCSIYHYDRTYNHFYSVEEFLNASIIKEKIIKLMK